MWNKRKQADKEHLDLRIWYFHAEVTYFLSRNTQHKSKICWKQWNNHFPLQDLEFAIVNSSGTVPCSHKDTQESESERQRDRQREKRQENETESFVG